MEEITLTCPFTGLEFNALADENSGSLVFTNPLTGLTETAGRIGKSYTLELDQTKHVPIVKAYDAKEILQVSKQRIAQIISNQTIPVKYINGEPYFLKSDVLDYRENRQVGAPRKDK